MLRRLFTPRWLGALLVATVWAVAGFFLGQWQYGRHEAKTERNARLDAHYAAPPVPLADVLTAQPLPTADEWTHVEVQGTYRPDAQQYVRNRPNDAVFGYEVLVPLAIDQGTVLVDRGWVKNSEEGATVLPPVPPAPSGKVTVIGWVRRGEASLGRHLPQGQLASINLGEASKTIGAPLLGGYVVLDTERTAAAGMPPRPQRLATPDRSLGPHQAYAFQWWFGMPVGLVLIYFGIRRELNADDPSWKPKAKKTRIWDEEDY